MQKRYQFFDEKVWETFALQKFLINFQQKAATIDFKGLLHCFSTCIEITGTNWYWFNLKNIENCKEKSQRVKKL